MKSSASVNIFKYYSAQEFISACYSEKAKANPRFSVRAWAKALKLRSHTVLHAVLNAKKKTPLSLYVPLSTDLKLSDEESHFLLVMINLENSKDQYSRLMLMDKLETLKKHKTFKMEELADFNLLSDPFWGQLIEMTDLADFSEEPESIRDRSRVSKSKEEIADVIKTLLANGFLTRREGRLSKTHQHVTNVHDLANVGSQKYHRNAALLAATQLERQTVQEREFNAYALNIKKADLPRIKASLRAYIKNFILEFEAAPNEGDSTYQFNSQFFSLTRDK